MGVHFYTSLVVILLQGLIQKHIAGGDPESPVQLLLTSNPRP